MSDKIVNHFVLADGSTAKYDAGALLNLDDTVSLAGYAPDAKAVGDRLTDVESVLYHYSILSFQPIGGYYATNTGIGNAIGSTFKTSAIFSQNIYDAVEGQKFRLTGLGCNAGRAWAFLDANDIILSVSGADLNCLGIEIVAPANTAKVAITFNTVLEHSVEKWMPYDISTFPRLVDDVDNLNELESADIILPSKIYCVLDRPFDITFKNITKCDNIKNYYYSVSRETSEFMNIGKSERIIASDAGTRTVKLTLLKNNVELANRDINIVSLTDNVKPPIKAIFIGDSFTERAIYIAELKRLLGENLTLYGTRTTNAVDSEGNTQTINHEGRAGWALKHYLQNSAFAQRDNAFFNPSTSTFDFSYYISQNNQFNDVTDIFILSGPNDWQYFETKEQYINYLRIISDSIKAYRSTIRIHIMTPLHCIDNGYSFGTHAYTYMQRYNDCMNQYTLGIIEQYDDAGGHSVIPTNINFDTWYDFERTTVQVNFRNPSTMETGTDFVHPSKYGYYRMSDMIYADIIGTCN